MILVKKIENKIGTKLARCYIRNRRKCYSNKVEVFRVGSTYGGWVLPKDIEFTENSKVLCAGAGEDISFDTEMTRIYKCKVVTVDPTPRAVEHWQGLKKNIIKGDAYYSLSGSVKFRYSISEEDLSRMIFLPVGISQDGGVLKFFYPKDPTCVSCSALNLQNTKDYFEAECLRYSQIMEKSGVLHFDLVKIDIEGAEYGVIEDILESGDNPEIICIDFDEINNVINIHVIARLKDAFNRLEQAGYYPIWFEGDSVTFRRQESS